MQADYTRAIECHTIDLHHVGETLAALIEMRPTPDHLLIVNVAVAPGFQQRGRGRELLAHAERVAVSLGLDEMRLYTNALMAANVRLYASLGYRVDREEPFLDGVVLHMSKQLDGLGPQHPARQGKGEATPPDAASKTRRSAL